MPNRKDKILVIGASGQIGVELTMALRVIGVALRAVLKNSILMILTKNLRFNRRTCQ
jgi:putative NADH-flavin reductase